MSTTKRVTVIFTTQEYEEIKREAGDVPLTRWIRRRALPETMPADVRALPTVDKEVGSNPSSKPAVENRRKAGRHCPLPVSKAASGSHSGENAQVQQAASESPSISAPVDMKRFLP